MNSTQQWCEERMRTQEFPEGTIVRAAEQTAGKGMSGNAWLTGKDLNIAFSMVLYPKFLPAKEAFMLNKVVALAVYQALVPCGFKAELSIKWPNDILVGRKKICGMIIRNQVQGEHLRSCIAGVGVNVNQNGFPPPLDQTATSVRMETGEETPLDVIFNRIIGQIDLHYLRLRQGAFGALDSAFLSALYGRGRRVKFEKEDGTFEATVQGVDRSGRLILIRDDGMETTHDMKEIRFLL